MALIPNSDLKLLRTFATLAFINPFSLERIGIEKKVLGDRYVDDNTVAWSRCFEDRNNDRPNVRRIAELGSELVERMRQSACDGQSFAASDLDHYWDVSTYVLLYRHAVDLNPVDMFVPATAKKVWKAFLIDYEHFVAIPGIDQIEVQPADHLFACLCQVHRAFCNIFFSILGDSLPSVKLREAVWQSVFTNDLRRYRKFLFNRMNTLPTLITGPSGTGKELAAQAIGASQYIPFDKEKGCFPKESANCFLPLNLSAMSPTLIESELFGHRKGAFTGAIDQRVGWLAKCPAFGAVFLDEIGELDLMLQVKLLRVVQQRTFCALGDDHQKEFLGKIIGATNRDLNQEMAAGRFREDLYYRLCADRIETPCLRSQLQQRPDDLPALVRYVSRKISGDNAPALADEATQWIKKNLGDEYPWRGNIRELEHCVSSIMIRGCYLPASTDVVSPAMPSDNPQPAWLNEVANGDLTADQLVQRYCDWTYQQNASYEATARKLGLDRRTVKAKIDALKAKE